MNCQCSGSITTAEIIGIVIGVIAILAIIPTVILIRNKYWRKQEMETELNPCYAVYGEGKYETEVWDGNAYYKGGEGEDSALTDRNSSYFS